MFGRKSFRFMTKVKCVEKVRGDDEKGKILCCSSDSFVDPSIIIVMAGLYLYLCRSCRKF